MLRALKVYPGSGPMAKRGPRRGRPVGTVLYECDHLGVTLRTVPDGLLCSDCHYVGSSHPRLWPKVKFARHLGEYEAYPNAEIFVSTTPENLLD